MRRNSSNISFWILRPTQIKVPLNMELPLLRQLSQPLQSTDYSNQIHNITNDYRPKQIPNLFTQFLHLYARLTNKYQVIIHAQSWCLFWWNIFIFFMTFVNLIEIPFILLIIKDSDYQIYEDVNFSIYYYCNLAIFILDMIVVRTRISYEENGRNLDNPLDILKYYLNNLFVYDLLAISGLILSSFPIEVIDYFKCLFVFKLVSLKEIDRQIKFKLFIRRHSIAIYGFLKLVFFIIFVTNTYSCIYFAIDYYYYMKKGYFYENGYLWINGSFSVDNIDLLQSFGHFGAYVYALYWSLQTARTCGYGVATPKNYVSVFYVNFVMLNLIVIFVYFANGVINIIITHGEGRRKKLGAINKLMEIAKEFQIARQTKNKLIEEIEFKNQQNQQLEKYLQSQLSQDLKKSFRYTFRQHFIDFIQIISLISQKNQSPFKIDIAKIIRHKHYFKGEMLVQSKSIQVPKIFLIERGTYLIQNNQLGYRKKESQWTIIGKRQFYFQRIPIYNVIAQQPLSGLLIDRVQFIECVKKYHKVYAKYRQILDSILVNKRNIQQFGIKCPFCDDYHLHQFCNRLNKWRDDLRIKRNEDDSSDNLRMKYNRMGSKSVKCLKHKCHSYEIDGVAHKSEYFKSYNI